MMKLHTLKPSEGSTKTRKRIGRGQGSGRGGTSTKGHKGAQSRSGYSQKFGFEGGQMPLQRRVPKFGFKNVNRISYHAINLTDIQLLVDKIGIKEVGKDILVQHGLASKNDLIKILGDGTLKDSVHVAANAFSKSAIASIEKSGGKAVKL